VTRYYVCTAPDGTPAAFSFHASRRFTRATEFRRAVARCLDAARSHGVTNLARVNEREYERVKAMIPNCHTSEDLL
jgi:hypothetical protein